MIFDTPALLIDPNSGNDNDRHELLVSSSTNQLLKVLGSQCGCP